MQIKFRKILSANTFVITLATIVLLLGMLFRAAVLEAPESRIYELLMHTQHVEAPSPVVIVGIDEKSIEKLGPFPWPRSFIADAVQIISEGGANAIGLGLLFADRELNPGLQEIKNLQEAWQEEKSRKPGSKSDTLEKLLDEAQTRLDHDALLIHSVKTTRNIVLPFEFFPAQNSESSEAIDNEKGLSGLMRVNSLPLIGKSGADDSVISTIKTFLRIFRPQSPDLSQIRETYRELAGKASALGHMNLSVDSDGVVRRLPLLLVHQGRYFPSISLQLVAKYRNLNIKKLSLGPTRDNFSALRLGNEIIPIDEDYNMFIRYRVSKRPIQKVSIADVLDKAVDPMIFQNKIVLIGSTSGSRTFAFQTPVKDNMTDVEILANATDTIVLGAFLSRPFWAQMVEIAVVVYFGLFLLFVIPKVNPRLGGLILGIFLMTWIGAAFILFKAQGVLMWIFPPMILSLAGYLFVECKKAVIHLRDQTYELNRTQGLGYQAQGLLDMAYEKFINCPLEKKEVKQLLYDLGLEFERKRMFNKALSVYEHILKAGKYKDLVTRIQNLRSAGTLVMNGKQQGPSGTLFLDETTVAPTFGRYEIIRELGQGAMGTVYLGKDPKIKREVAIKTLAYNTVAPDEIKEVKFRFFHEAETAGRLSHPNIVTIYDIGEERDMAYMAMELLDGEDLAFHCQKDNLLPLEKLLAIMSNIADALDYAHQNSVVHRDIKPSNIMLLKTGQVKVTDFGIARVMDSSKTKTGLVLGTPSYMSPEQIAGKKVDGRSDLFSLGIVFYELLTGERPFKGDNLTSLVYAITKGEYTPLQQLLPDLDPCCVDIVDKLMSKGLTRRFQSAEKVGQKIRECMEYIGISGE